MTPQERDLLNGLIERLRHAPRQQKDAEADALITQLLRDQPDAAYILAQTVLIQDYALSQAQRRIAELEQQGQAAQQNQGGFLGAIFGNHQQPAPRSQGYAQPYQPPAGAPQAGPWGSAPAGYPVQAFGQQPSFMRSAAETAVGVAGGALLFEGVQSLFGGHGGFGGYGGGFVPQPSLTETTINNYYGSDPGFDRGTDTVASDPGAGDTRFADYVPDDNSPDPGFDGDPGGDFGNDDTWT